MTGIARSTISGYDDAHSIACSAPIDAPITATSFFTPSESSSAFCVRTKSLIVTIGKRIP